MYNLNDWKTQFLSEHVQSQNVKGADFLSSETVVVVSGPPTLSEVDTPNLVPIGLVQNVSVAQQKQLQQIFEIGSRKPFFVPGRTIISAGISRILFDGPSLMYAMYVSKSTGGKGTDVNMPAYNVPVNGTEAPVAPLDGFAPVTGVDATDNFSSNAHLKNNPTDTATPGLFFVNLASGFFNRPLGLGFVLYDGEQQAYGGLYLEGCYVQSHQFNIASQQTILVENVSLRCTAIRPIDPASIA